MMLVIDASTGQNAISQASLFNAAVGITGVYPNQAGWHCQRRSYLLLSHNSLQLPIRFCRCWGNKQQIYAPFDAQDLYRRPVLLRKTD